MIKILIADDSPTDTAILKYIFESDPDLSVIACASNGIEAVELVEKLRPDLVTMDIKMPKMDGYEAIENIMSKFATPIVVISSMISDSESEATFRALDAGALAVIPKPVNIQSPLFEDTRRRIIDTIKSMSEIIPITKRKVATKLFTDINQSLKDRDFEIVVIGASVGGPQALKLILSRLPSTFPVPIVAVQHMSHGFVEGFTRWLDSHVGLHVKYAEQGERLMAGAVYFAPDHMHFKIRKRAGDNGSVYYADLAKGDPVAGFCPSITVLMQSAANVTGKHTLGLLLTGMGSDGAEGMLALKQQGAHTFIQDAKSCVVFGMASVAQKMGAVDKTVDLDKIAEYLIRVTNKKNPPK